MNNKLITTLTVVCLTLLFIITLEWLYATHAQKQLLSAISSGAKQTLLDKMPVIDLNIQPEESYTDLVDRPLFIKDRKPVPESEQAQVTSVTNTFDWLLSGVYTSKTGLMALLKRTTPLPTTAKTPTNKKYQKVIVGADIDGWKVTKIYPDKIILTQDVTEKELLLRKKPKPRSNPNEAMNTPPSVPESFPEPQVEPETVPEPQTEPELVPEPQTEPINNAPNQ